MKSIVSEKGQITIPKRIRDRLGLKPGTVLDFDAEGGRLVARKRVVRDALSAWRGVGRLPAGGRVDDYLQEVRG